MDWLRFASQVRSAKSIDECRRVFRTAIGEHGFDTYACGELDLADRDRHAFFVIDWPEHWKTRYLSRSLIKRDPLLEALPLYRRPFTWSELRRDYALPNEAEQVLAQAAREGWHDGLVIPLPRAKSTRYGLMSMKGREPLVSIETRQALEVISVTFFEKVRQLLPTDGFAVAPANLTKREIESIQAAARGLSDKGIAEALQIAAPTAHEYIESAKRKLKVRNRTELVALCLSLGIVAA